MPISTSDDELEGIPEFCLLTSPASTIFFFLYSCSYFRGAPGFRSTGEGRGIDRQAVWSVGPRHKFSRNWKLHSSCIFCVFLFLVVVLTEALADDWDKLQHESNFTSSGSKNNRSSSALPPSRLALCHIFGGSRQPYGKNQGGLHAHCLQTDLHRWQVSQQLWAGKHHHHHQWEWSCHRYPDSTQLQSR